MTHHLSCHCGATRIEIDRLPDHANLCNCSFCSKRGALWGYFDPAEPRITIDGGDAIYAPNSNKHHFCPTCGCTTYTLTPNWLAQYMHGAAPVEDGQMALNLRLLDDADPDSLPVEKIDGRGGW